MAFSALPPCPGGHLRVTGSGSGASGVCVPKLELGNEWERVGTMDRQTPLILADVSDFFPVFLEFEFWAVVSVMTLNALGFGNFERQTHLLAQFI